MRLMLTSCGLETEKIRDHFLKMLGKDPRDTRALFIPTAAIRFTKNSRQISTVG